MYTALFQIYRKEGWTHEQFLDYWLNVHKPLAASVSELRGYTLMPVTKAIDALGEEPDGFVQLTFDSREHFHQVLRSDEFRPVLEDGDVFCRHVTRYTVDLVEAVPVR